MLIDYDFYKSNGFNKLSEAEFTRYIKKSERQINTVCFNRINNGTIDYYQSNTQDIIKNIICEHAEFIKDFSDNSENGVLKSYSNGTVSYSFENSTSSIIIKNGVQIKSDLYGELVQTGICSRCVC